MQGIRNPGGNINLNFAKIVSRKLRTKNLDFFNLNFKSKYNESIISLNYYIYYRDIFI